MSSSAGGVSLPPLRRSAESLEACLDQGYSAEASQLRQTRKAELMSCVLGHSPGSQGPQTGLLLDLELKEQKLAATQKHKPVRLILEGWVDEVLANTGNQQQHSLHHQQQPQLSNTGALRGAAAAGLSRQQLLAAGLSSAAVEQLYRCLYVYTMGFVDTIKELLGFNEHRQELLQAIWQAFLLLAEHSMKATFKSDYLALVTAAGTAATELLCTKHTLAEVRQDNAAMVKDLGSLSAAEAEASAQRSSLKAQVDDLTVALATEQTAHKRAVQQYVDALDAKSAMQLQFEASQQALQELSCAHQMLQQQHQQLQQRHSGLVGQCCVVRDICKHLDEALGLDPQLVQQVQQWREANSSSERESTSTGLEVGTQQSDPLQPPASQQQDQQSEQDVQPSPTDDKAPLQELPAAEPDGATDLQPLAEKLEQQMQAMYASWRAATNARDAALTERFRMVDQLRDSEQAAYQMQQQHKALQQVLQEAQQHLSSSQAESADLTKRLTGAHESLAQAQLDLGEAQGDLQHTRDSAAALEQRCSQLDESIELLRDEVADLKSDRIKLQAQLTAAARRLGEKHRLMAELSKGFAVAMQGAMANQTARGVSDKLLKAEKAKGAHMNSSLNSKDRLLHDLQAQVREQSNQISKLQAELQLLESSLQDSQRQAMALGTRLTLTETKNDELISQNQTQADQLAEAVTKINKLVTRLEQAKQQLDKANKEIKDLKDAAQVSERIISDGRLLSKSLTADVERITREKQVAQERAETTKARLELEVQRLSGELSAAERKLELKAADLAAERDRVAAQATLLECKRGKKRRWKEAYHTASDEVATLHTQLLAKHKDLEVLEGHLNQLHTELAMLGINTGAGLNTAGLRPRSSSSASSRPQSAARPGSAAAATAGSSRPTSAQASAAVGLAEARASHVAAAEGLARVQEQWHQLDKQVEELETQQQQMLLSLADPSLSESQIKSIQATVEGKRAQVQDLRQQRLVLVTARGAAAAELRKAETVLRDAHHARLQQRQLLLEKQTMQASDLINAAALGQLAAAEEAELAVRAALSQQVAAFESLQADKSALEQRMQDLQAGIDTFMNRISGLEGDKAGLEVQLTRTHHMITCLQAEVSAVNSERDRIRNNASQAEQRIAALESELEAAKQAVTLALKGMEAKHAAERQLQEQRLVAERNKAAKATEAADAAVSALKGRITHLRTSLIEVSTQCYGYACVSTTDRVPLLDRDSSSGNNSSSGGSSSAANSSSGGRNIPLLPLQGQPLTQYGAYATLDHSKLATQPVSAPGVRWLYMHLPDSPWRRTRLLLLQPQQEAPEGLLRQNSSVPPTPRGSNGRTLGIPPSLPGLSFGPENLPILIGELLLHKIDLNAASDERLLMCTTAAAVGVASASSTTASSRAASRPATAASRPSTASANAGGGSSAGGVAAAAAAGALLGALPGVDEEGQGSAGPLRGGSAAAVAAWWSTRFRMDLEGAVFEYFMTRCGCRLLADAHCSALVLAVRKSAGRSKRAALFGRCLGLLEPVVPPAGVGVLLHFLAQLHSTCPGPLSTEASEGSSQVVARTAAQLAMQALQPTGPSPCAEVSSLSAAITAAAGGSSDNAVEVDTVLELLEGAWIAQRAVEQQQLERIYAQTDSRGKGITNQEEFAGLVKTVAPAVGHHLHHEQVSWLFTAALAASGNGSLAVSPAGFATAVLDAGLVGSAAHLRRHPVINQRPPYSDYRLLGASWQAVKGPLKEVLRMLPKTQPALAPEVTAVSTLVQRLDEAMSIAGPPAGSSGDAWQLYRRILGFYCLYGSFPEACSVPNTPRMLGSASGGSVSSTPR